MSQTYSPLIKWDWSIQNWNIKGKFSSLSYWSSVNALFHNSLNFFLSNLLLKIIRILITFMCGLHRYSHLYKMTAVFSFLWQPNFMESSKRNHISFLAMFYCSFQSGSLRSASVFINIAYFCLLSSANCYRQMLIWNVRTFIISSQLINAEPYLTFAHTRTYISVCMCM